ncbi:unnamed protein product [Vicia faba]|uniref:Uncharacterized protein n=1 Tax=Vicia faba TaxID=3906 RepID=A0AAV1BC50_VICFA|nr:unnamed protein product [Vicia faba]
MEHRLLKDFDLQPKNPSAEALRRWRFVVTLVKNRRRRFRMVADLEKRFEANRLSTESRNLSNNDGVEAVARKLSVSTDEGVSEATKAIAKECGILTDDGVAIEGPSFRDLSTEQMKDIRLKRPPVGRGESFITKTMWRNIIGQLIVLAILNFDGKRLLKIDGSDATQVLNTLIFNSFLFCQLLMLFNEINTREMEKINIAFQAVIVEFLGAFASTVPLSWQFL